ncbi:MAG TPA: hypothetical protein VGV09_03980 [Steroidobacteraceae bacterium]|nr:hypothetical protein [Steroidobacteraceae bacterium]
MAIAVAGLAFAGGAWSQAPASAPSGTTGLCKDGSFTSTATKKGACRGHKGVQTWYAAAAATSTAAQAETPPATTAPAVPAAKSAPTPAPTRAAAPGGGPGQVWVNTASNVYHCPGDRYYGKTKAGAYMSEADAKAHGNRPDHGKSCQ